MRHRRHHPALHQIQLPRQICRRPAARAARGVSHRFERASGPVVVDIPKDIQFAKGAYFKPTEFHHRGYRPKLKGDADKIMRAVEMMAAAKRPLFYTGGGVINSGRRACDLLRELVKLTGFPITSTLMGLGAFPAADPQWLGMLGMHGTWEANWSMHDCDLMIAVGARFDDRITGRLDAFSPGSKKIHI